MRGAPDKEGEEEEVADKSHWLMRKQFGTNSTFGVLTPMLRPPPPTFAEDGVSFA